MKALLLLTIIYAASGEQCDHLGTLLYEDLKFEAKLGENGCPSEYIPKDYKNTEKHCLFQAKQIDVGQEIDGNLTYPSCKIACRCNGPQDGQNLTSFECGILDCPEWLGVPLDGPDCYRTYTLDHCCSTGAKCPPFDAIAKCDYNGTEYKEGEQFYPENSCLECVCQEGFDGKLEAPFCKRKSCAAQIHDFKEIGENCAPIYSSDSEALCCPNHWVCPTENDVIKKINPDIHDSDLTCTFGDRKVKLGEGLETKYIYYDDKERDVLCECILPPFLTCKETKK